MGNAQTNILAQLLAELDSGGLKIVDLTSPLEPDTVVIDLPPIFAPSYQTGQRLNLRRPHQERCSAWRSMPPMQSFRNSAPAHYSPPALRAPVVPCWKLTARLAGFLPLGPDFAAQRRLQKGDRWLRVLTRHCWVVAPDAYPTAAPAP